MATGDTINSICNMALFQLGEDSIVNVLPNPPVTDNTKRAILCSQLYDPTRRAVLQSAPWLCAKRQAVIPVGANAPLFNYLNGYPLPQDFLRVFEWPEEGRPAYELLNLTAGGRIIGAGTAIVTTPFNLTYVCDLQDPTQMDPLLVEAIALALAANLCLPLTQNPALIPSLEQRVGIRLAAARNAASASLGPAQSSVEPIPTAAPPQGAQQQ